MTTKDAVLRLIAGLPEDATLSDIMAELYFRQKVDKGREVVSSGRFRS